MQVKTAEQTQTEIASAEGAEALKAMNIEPPLVSREENKKNCRKVLHISRKSCSV